MSILNLGDMIEEARNLLDDKLIDGSDLDCLWKDGELTTYANEAINEVALRTKCLGMRDGVAGFNQFEIDPSASLWVLVDSRILRFLRVTWNGKRIGPVSKDHLDACSDDWESETGEPNSFVYDQSNREVRPYPKPTSTGTLQFEVKHLPRTLLSDSADVPVVPQHMLQPAVFWILHLAYLKNDSETKDDNLAGKYMTLFEHRFGPRPSYRDQEFVSRSLKVVPRGRFEYR